MRVGIIGQGVSGLFAGLMIKKEHPSYEVTIIDKNIAPGKKILATGNGRCNICNIDLTNISYNNPEGLKIVDKFNSGKITEYLKTLGILTRNIGSLVYPYSLSAKQLLEQLLNRAEALKIKFENNLKVEDYKVYENRVEIITNKKLFSFEKVIFACGSASAKNLGGTTETYELLKKHDYKITSLKPGLCPIKTVEETRTVESQRVKCTVTLEIDKQKIYEENGEVIFKKNGLSGISIFNCASMIARFKKFKKANIYLDMLPEYSEEEAFEMLNSSEFEKNSGLLQGFLPKPVAEYVRKRAGIEIKNHLNKDEITKLVSIAKHLCFTYLDSYSFDESQVTVGGLSLESVDKTLQSKTEKGVYFVGELLDVDGLCGGYNIMFAIASARLVASSINQ